MIDSGGPEMLCAGQVGTSSLPVQPEADPSLVYIRYPSPSRVASQTARFAIAVTTVPEVVLLSCGALSPAGRATADQVPPPSADTNRPVSVRSQAVLFLSPTIPEKEGVSCVVGVGMGVVETGVVVGPETFGVACELPVEAA
jgi:hypothetical protein